MRVAFAVDGVPITYNLAYVQPQGALFNASSDVFTLDGYGCTRYELNPQDVHPPTYTMGSGMAECARGSRGFDIIFQA